VSLFIEFALRFRQGSWLDQQALSFVAAAAESYQDRMSRAFRLDPAREQRISRAQELKIVETDAAQARRAGISIMRRSPVPPHRWQIQASFNGWITTGSGHGSLYPPNAPASFPKARAKPSGFGTPSRSRGFRSG
jgi:hypothetical protein